MTSIGRRRGPVSKTASGAGKVLETANMLVRLYRKNLVKTNHSALEPVCARSLIKEGYDVRADQRVDRRW